jgi:hypothetical protein
MEGFGAVREGTGVLSKKGARRRSAIPLWERRCSRAERYEAD